MLWKKNNSNNSIFGTVKFLNGWQSTNRFEITLWGKKNNVYIRATAIDKKEPITPAQEKAFLLFSQSSDKYSRIIERAICENFPSLSEEEIIERFVPEEIVFPHDGSFAICIGDNEDEDCAIQPDADIAIQLYPSVIFYNSQEQYLSFLD